MLVCMRVRPLLRRLPLLTVAAALAVTADAPAAARRPVYLAPLGSSVRVSLATLGEHLEHGSGYACTSSHRALCQRLLSIGRVGSTREKTSSRQRSGHT